jgi:hypothetical protein
MYAMGKAPASSKLMRSGMAKVSASGAAASSARPPWARIAITRSPGLKRVTLSPQAVTIPAASRPGLKGSGGFVW